MDDEKLIELVRVHPAIYDPSHRKYMDTKLKANMWKNIGRELGVSGQVCKSRWSNIRDNFRKNIQKNVSKRRQGHKSRKPYKYHKQLRFLVNFFDDRTKIENVIDEDSTAHNDESDIVKSPTRGISPASETHHTDSVTYSPIQSPASPYYAEASFMNQYGSLSARSQEHPVDIFLASLAPTLKELHPCDLFNAKSEMFAIIQKYEAKLLRTKFPKLAHESSTISQNRSNVINFESVMVEDHESDVQ